MNLWIKRKINASVATRRTGNVIWTVYLQYLCAESLNLRHFCCYFAINVLFSTSFSNWIPYKVTHSTHGKPNCLSRIEQNRTKIVISMRIISFIAFSGTCDSWFFRCSLPCKFFFRIILSTSTFYKIDVNTLHLWERYT